MTDETELGTGLDALGEMGLEAGERAILGDGRVFPSAAMEGDVADANDSDARSCSEAACSRWSEDGVISCGVIAGGGASGTGTLGDSWLFDSDSDSESVLLWFTSNCGMVCVASSTSG